MLPAEGQPFPKLSDWLWAPFNLLRNEYHGIFSQHQSSLGVKLNIQRNLMPRLRKLIPVPPLSKRLYEVVICETLRYFYFLNSLFRGRENRQVPQLVCRPKFQILFLARMTNLNFIRHKNHFVTPKFIHCLYRLLRSLRRGSVTLAFYDWGGFESHRRHSCLFIVSVVFCYSQVYTIGLSFIQKVHTE